MNEYYSTNLIRFSINYVNESVWIFFQMFENDFRVSLEWRSLNQNISLTFYAYVQFGMPFDSTNLGYEKTLSNAS